MAIKKMTDLDLAGKRVLIREDLNVPLAAGRVTSDKRIRASLPTIQHAMAAGARVLLMSHLGRPTEGQYEEQYSLAPVAGHLSELLGTEVAVCRDYLDQPPQVGPGQAVLLENVRFNAGEKNNAPELARRYAELCDIYVMDAFGTAHRAQASTHGVAEHAAVACAGPLLAAELDALGRALQAPKRPLLAVVGGSKVSTKLTVLEALSGMVDQLIPGGGIANTFLAAAGFEVGKSLYEPDLVDEAKRLMRQAAERGGEIPIPTDVVVGKKFSADASAAIKPAAQVSADEMIFDIGPETARRYGELVRAAGTVVWNGPVGVFEFDQFGEGTRVLGEAIAASDAFSIAGGGDTLAAVDKYGLADRISYISTGGGAFLEFLEGKALPAVTVLEARSA